MSRQCDNCVEQNMSYSLVQIYSLTSYTDCKGALKMYYKL